MSNIIDRQTIIISINCFTFKTTALGVETKSIVNLPMNLRFAADALIVKNIAYNAAPPPNGAQADTTDVIQIWCNITTDNIIAAFPNAGNNSLPTPTSLGNCFRISNSFQTGNFILELQRTDGTLSDAPLVAGPVASFNPQRLISSYPNGSQTTFGIVSITIEFIKLKDKSIY